MALSTPSSLAQARGNRGLTAPLIKFTSVWTVCNGRPAYPSSGHPRGQSIRTDRVRTEFFVPCTRNSFCDRYRLQAFSAQGSVHVRIAGWIARRQSSHA